MKSKVTNFKYNGFFVQPLEGYAKYELTELVEWTNDPGVGIFKCTDGRKRLIPTCEIVSKEFLDSLPPRPELESNAIGGKGEIFGQPASSK